MPDSNIIVNLMNKMYARGIQEFDKQKYPEAAACFAASVKPVLSKVQMKQITFRDAAEIYNTLKNDSKEKNSDSESNKSLYDQVLDSMYRLGRCYLEEVNALINHKGTPITAHYAKAAGIFQYCAAFGDKAYGEQGSDKQRYYREHITNWKNKKTEYINAAAQVESEFLNSLDIDSKEKSDISESDITRIIAEIESYKKELEEIRETVKSELDSIKDHTVANIQKRSEEVQKIYEESNKFFINHKPGKGFLQSIIKDCETQLSSTKPDGLEYSIIGLGSIALGTMTPWSDIEFAILINDSGNKEKQEKYKEYCRNLTKLMRIKIVNLGETPLRGLGIEYLNNFKTANEADEWFWDDILSSGFSFDGAHWHACKSPLGRNGYKAKPDFELIGTSTELVAFQKQKTTDEQEANWFASDPILVQTLRSVCYIHGQKILLNNYQEELLKPALVSNENAQKRSLQLLSKNIGEFSLKLGDEEEGKLIDVKKDIYRLPDRIIVRLYNYYRDKIQKADSNSYSSTPNMWQMIDGMLKAKILSKEGAKHLKQAVSIAAELRMNTYANNDGQSETMSSYIPTTKHLTEEEAQTLIHKTFYIKDTSILHHFYYVMLNLQTIITKFCDKSTKDVAEDILQQNTLLTDSNYNKGMVHARFLNYSSAIYYLEKIQDKDIKIYMQLSQLYSTVNNITKALNLVSGFDLVKMDNCFFKAKIYITKGALYRREGNEKSLSEAKLNLEHGHKILDKMKSYNKQTCVLYLEIASYYGTIGEIEKANKLCEEIIKNNGSKEILSFAKSILAINYFKENNIEDSIKEHKESLKLKEVIYEKRPNDVSILETYCNLGDCYSKQGLSSKAQKYYNNAIRYAANPGYKNILLAASIGLISVYQYDKDFTNAIACAEKAIKFCKDNKKKVINIMDYARIKNNLSGVYFEKGEKKQAENCLLHALDQKQKFYKDYLEHPEIAGSYLNLSKFYSKQQDIYNAKEYLNKAIEIHSSNNYYLLDPQIKYIYEEITNAFIDVINTHNDNANNLHDKRKRIENKTISNTVFKKNVIDNLKYWSASIKIYSIIFKIYSFNQDSTDILKNNYPTFNKYNQYLIERKEYIKDQINTIYGNFKKMYCALQNDLGQDCPTFFEQIKIDEIEAIINFGINESNTKNCIKLHKQIIQHFQKQKPKHQNSDNDLEIELCDSEIEEKNLIEYCKQKLKLNKSDITIDDNSYSITLNSNAKSILRAMIPEQNTDDVNTKPHIKAYAADSNCPILEHSKNEFLTYLDEDDSNSLASDHNEKEKIAKPSLTNQISNQEELDFISLADEIKEYFIPDKFGNSKISNAIFNKDYAVLKQVNEQLFSKTENFDNIKFLTSIALFITKNYENLGINQDVAENIYYTAKEELVEIGILTDEVIAAGEVWIND